MEKSRPQKLNPSRSFSRFEPSRNQTPTRGRASTLSNEITSPGPDTASSAGGSSQDIFEKDEAKVKTPSLKDAHIDGSEGNMDVSDELPIELASLTDR
jgi:hypothetical protein